MRDEIAKIYGKRRYGFAYEGIEQRREALNFADQILALLKEKGWVHKDDPVKGLEVERECPNNLCVGLGKIPLECSESTECGGTGKLTSPLTVGEALEMIDKLIHIAKQVCKVGCIHRETTCDPIWTCKSCWVGKALQTPSGGRVKVKEK